MRSWAFFGVLLVALFGCGDERGSDPVDSGMLAIDAGDTPDSEPLPADDAATDGGEVAPDASTPPPGGAPHTSFRPEGFDASDATRLVIMGDSIAHGFGVGLRAHVAGHLLAENDDAMWPASATHDLESFLGMVPEVIDVSADGATTGAVISNQLPQVDSMLASPVSGKTVVMVIAGGNDLQASIVGGDPTGSVLTNALMRLRTISEFFQNAERFPDGSAVMVMDVYDPSDGVAQIPGCFFNLRLPTFVEALDVWRDRFTELGTELGFAVVDALGHFHGHAHHYDDPSNPYFDAADNTHWFSDCIHPNERGHHEIRRLFYELIDPTQPAD